MKNQKCNPGNLWSESDSLEDLAQEARVQAKLIREKAQATQENYKDNKRKINQTLTQIDKALTKIDHMMENLKSLQKNPIEASSVQSKADRKTA